jgi:polyisoprenoid-binding protein YceI
VAALWLLLLAACAGEEPAEPTATFAPPATTSATPAGDVSLAGATFVIDPAASQVRFEIDEVLRGAPNLVIGQSNGVSGQVTADLAALAGATIGPITIDATSLATDNNMRNRAIGRWILESGDYPTITFTPTAVVGLPQSAAIGEEISFTIEGDLTIRDVTQPVEFAATAIAASADELRGAAQTTINRADFELSIPNVPMVANVGEQVLLAIDFVARAQS